MPGARVGVGDGRLAQWRGAEASARPGYPGVASAWVRPNQQSLPNATRRTPPHATQGGSFIVRTGNVCVQEGTRGPGADRCLWCDWCAGV